MTENTQRVPTGFNFFLFILTFDRFCPHPFWKKIHTFMPKRPLKEYLELEEESLNHELISLEATDEVAYEAVKTMLEMRQQHQQYINQERAARIAAEEELAIANEELVIANEELVIANEELAIANEELAIANAKNVELEFASNLRSGTITARFHFIMENITQHETAGMTWRKPDDRLIINAWNKVKAECINLSANSVASDVKDLTQENAKVHPVFLKLISVITSIVSGKEFNCLLRPRLNMPNLVPDIVITRKGISRCTWSEAFVLIELKTANVEITEAIPQCVEYLYSAYKKLNSQSGPVFRIGIASNLTSIMVFHLPVNLLDMKRSATLSLFPSDWCLLNEPTEGFKLLCHALTLTLPSEKIVSFQMGGAWIKCIAKKILRDDGECEVSVVNHNGRDLIVKQAKGKYAKGIISKFELFNYQEISKIAGMAPFIVPLREEYEIQHGFVADYASGESIDVWIENCQIGSDGAARDQALKSLFLHVFKGLKLLHENHWFHKDIRPENIVVSGDGTAKLIDWATAIHCPGPVADDAHIFYQGHSDPFWPDDLRLALEPSKWDLVGFGLVICFLTLSEVDRLAAFQNVSNRASFLRSFSEAHPDSLTSVGAKIFLECSDRGTEIDYDRIESMISSYGVIH